MRRAAGGGGCELKACEMGSVMSSGGGRGCQAVCSPQVRSGLKVTGGALRVGENRSMSSRRAAAWGW